MLLHLQMVENALTAAFTLLLLGLMGRRYGGVYRCHCPRLYWRPQPLERRLLRHKLLCCPQSNLNDGSRTHRRACCRPARPIRGPARGGRAHRLLEQSRDAGQLIQVGPSGFTTLHAAVLGGCADTLPALVAAGAPLALEVNGEIAPLREFLEFCEVQNGQRAKMLRRAKPALAAAMRFFCMRGPSPRECRLAPRRADSEGLGRCAMLRTGHSASRPQDAACPGALTLMAVPSGWLHQSPLPRPDDVERADSLCRGAAIREASGACPTHPCGTAARRAEPLVLEALLAAGYRPTVWRNVAPPPFL